MNNKQCKRMRKHIRQLLPDGAATVYKEINAHQKTFVLQFGTHVDMTNPKIHKIMTPPAKEGEPELVIVAVDCAQRVLDVCQRKFYKQLKRDVQRAQRGSKVVYA